MLRNPFSTLIVSVAIALIVGFLSGWLGALTQEFWFTPAVPYEDTLLNRQAAVVSTKAVLPAPRSANHDDASVLSARAVSVYVQSASNLYGAESRLGFGSVVTTDGWILTTDDVVGKRHASELVIGTDRGALLKLTQIVRDPSTNLVLLKTEGYQFFASTFGRISSTALGDSIILATPERILLNNLGGSEVLISTKEQQAHMLNRIWHTQAPLEKSLVGTPVFIERNRALLGVVAELQGSATPVIVPVEHLSTLLSMLLRSATIERPTIGVSGVDLGWIASTMTSKRSPLYAGGFLITNVLSRDASIVGLQRGDIITVFNGTVLDRLTSLSELIAELEVGQRVEFTIVRAGKEQVRTLTVIGVRA